ncbi:MAG: hypothetical protein WCB77_26735, partial [Pseudolabrys sp.]
MEHFGTFIARLKLQPQVTRNGAIAAVVLIICTWLLVAMTTRAPHAVDDTGFKDRDRARSFRLGPSG